MNDLPVCLGLVFFFSGSKKIFHQKNMVCMNFPCLCFVWYIQGMFFNGTHPRRSRRLPHKRTEQRHPASTWAIYQCSLRGGESDPFVGSAHALRIVWKLHTAAGAGAAAAAAARMTLTFDLDLTTGSLRRISRIQREGRVDLILMGSSQNTK